MIIHLLINLEHYNDFKYNIHQFHDYHTYKKLKINSYESVKIQFIWLSIKLFLLNC